MAGYLTGKDLASYAKSIYGAAPDVASKMHLTQDTVNLATHKKNALDLTLLIDYHINNVGVDADSVQVLDAMACIGGDTYALQTAFSVVAVEVDKARYDMLVNNMALLNTKRSLQLVNDNVHNFLRSRPASMLKNIAAVYIDAPWGSKDYYAQPEDEVKLTTFDNQNRAIDLVDMIADLRTRLPSLVITVVKVPFNFDSPGLLNRMRLTGSPFKFEVHMQTHYDLIAVVFADHYQQLRYKHVLKLHQRAGALPFDPFQFTTQAFKELALQASDEAKARQKDGGRNPRKGTSRRGKGKAQ